MPKYAYQVRFNYIAKNLSKNYQETQKVLIALSGNKIIIYYSYENNLFIIVIPCK